MNYTNLVYLLNSYKYILPFYITKVGNSTKNIRNIIKNNNN